MKLSTTLILFVLAMPVLAQPPNSRVVDPDPAVGTGISASSFEGAGTCPAPINLCYYDTSFLQGNPTQLPPIATAGHSPIDVVTPDAAGLTGCDVLFAQNPSNGDYGAEWGPNLVDIDAAVQAGMVLVFHDRRVTEAASNIPGLAATTCLRDFVDDANVDVVDNTTSVTNGPGGLIDGTSLDGGNSSTHGFCADATLPAANPLSILSRTLANESVTFSYSHGIGAVVYSTIPLDFYLAGGLPLAFGDIYAPNVVQYGADIFCAAQLPVTVIPTLGSAGLALLVMFLGLSSLIWLRKSQGQR